MGDSLRAGSLADGSRSPSHRLRRLWNGPEPMVLAVRFPGYWTLVQRGIPVSSAWTLTLCLCPSASRTRAESPGMRRHSGPVPENRADMPLELAAAVCRSRLPQPCIVLGTQENGTLMVSARWRRARSFARLSAGCRRIQRGFACAAAVVSRGSRSLRSGQLVPLMP